VSALLTNRPLPIDDGPKTVWIIGAGASIADTNGEYPALNDIPAKSQRYGLLRSSDQGPGYVVLREYIQDRFGLDLSRAPRLDLEAALTHLEIDISTTSDPKLLFARYQLLRLLRDTFLALADDVQEDLGFYTSLANARSSRDSFITFNWDCRLDDALGRQSLLRNPSGDLMGPYGEFLMRFSGIGDGTIARLGVQKPLPSWPDRRGLYLKAHGSVDWFSCINSECQNTDSLFPIMGSESKHRCGWCYEPLEVVLVPPTLNKRLRDNSLIRRIWTAASEEIRVADSIVAWGYSLPPTDFFSSWLLRQASPERLNKLTIINPALVTKERGSIAVNRDFVGRYLAVVAARKSDLVVKLYESYSDYVAKIPLQDRYSEARQDIDRSVARMIDA
jgi:hypothetical protein